MNRFSPLQKGFGVVALVMASLVGACAHRTKLDDVLPGRPFWYRGQFLGEARRYHPDRPCGSVPWVSAGELEGHADGGCRSLGTLVEAGGIEWPRADGGQSIVTGPCVGVFTQAFGTEEKRLILRATSKPALWAAWWAEPAAKGFAPISPAQTDFVLVRDEAAFRAAPRFLSAAKLRATKEGATLPMFQVCGSD